MILKYFCRKPGQSLLSAMLTLLIISGCSREKPKENDRPTFKAVLGMQYIETDRYFTSRLSFNDQGYELEPTWKMYLLSDDSLMIFHPQAKVFYHYPIYHDHDSVFNIARHWMRIKTVSKDSLIFQLLSVEEKKVSKDFSNAYMKFYSYAYLQKTHADPEQLRKPSHKDTLFIQAKSAKANRNPGVRDSAFAARMPVVLKSKIPEIKVNKLKVQLDPHDLLHVSPSDEYLYPEYSITIDKAYRDFNYSFSVLVDDKGSMRLSKFTVSPEFKESRRRVLEGIIDVYLERFLDIKPGTTLGIAHTSEIALHVKGTK